MTKDTIRLLGPVQADHAYTGPLPVSGRSWDMVLERWGVPLLDSEVNLMQQINRERIEDFITAFSLPGWLKASAFSASTASDVGYATSPHSITLPEDSWFVSNGKMVHVANPDLNAAGGVRIDLPSRPGSGTRSDLVILEIWRHEIAPLAQATAAAPTTPNTTENPTSSSGQTRDQVFKEGGIGNNTHDNDLISTATVGIGGDPGDFGETTRRIQLRWRFRVIQNVDFATYRYGLGTSLGATNPSILAQGGKMADGGGIATYTFQEVPPTEGLGTLYLNNAEIYGKGRLWRAGANTLTAGNALNTVDGYVYAVPVFRLDMSTTTLTSVTDMRQLSHVYIPNHVIHADQVTTYDDPSQAGVYGAAFETTNDPVLGRIIKSNIRRNSITGGTSGDIAIGTITTDNLAVNIGGNIIQDGSLSIKKLNLDTTGLATVWAENRSGGTRSNGDIVVLEQDTLQTWDGFYLSTPTNTTVVGSAGVAATVVGVLANYASDGTELTVANGVRGLVRIHGKVTKLNVSGTISPGMPLMTSASVNGVAVMADGTRDIIGFALSGGSSPVNALIVAKIPANSIRTSKLVDSSVTTPKIADQAVTPAKIVNNSIADGQLATGAVLTRAMGDLQVTTGKIALNAVTEAQLAAGAVTGSRLAQYAVGGDRIANNGITTAHITAFNIINDHIASGNIQLRHMASGSVGAAQIIAAAVRDPNLGLVMATSTATGNFTIPNDGAPHAISFNSWDLVNTLPGLSQNNIWQISDPDHFNIQKNGLYIMVAHVWWVAVPDVWYSSIEILRNNDGYLLGLDAGQHGDSSLVQGVPGSSIYGNTYTTQTCTIIQPLSTGTSLQVRLLAATNPLGSPNTVGVDRVRVSLYRVGDYA